MFLKKKRLAYAGLLRLYIYPKNSFIGQELRSKNYRILRDVSLLLHAIDKNTVSSVSEIDVKKLQYLYNRLELIINGLSVHPVVVLRYDSVHSCWAKLYVKEKQAKRIIEKMESLFALMWNCLPQREKNAVLPAGYG